MPKITIDKEKCKGCLLCVTFCPKKLITVSGKLNKRGANTVEFSRQSNLKEGGIPLIRRGKADNGCLGCAMCAVICPDCCIEVFK